MPTGKLNLPWLASRITEKEYAQLGELLKRKTDPRQAKLEKKRAALKTAIAKLDAEIAALTGEGKPAAKKRGRKPGKRAVGRPTAAKTAKAAKPPKSSDRTPEQQAAIDARMAKARAARAAKLASAK